MRGIATEKESLDLIKEVVPLYAKDTGIEQRMNDITKEMIEIGNISDSSLKEIEDARNAFEEVHKAINPWAILLNILAAARIDSNFNNLAKNAIREWISDPESIQNSAANEEVNKSVNTIQIHRRSRK